MEDRRPQRKRERERRLEDPTERGRARDGRGSRELQQKRGREKAGGRGLEKAQTQRGLYRIVVSVRNRGAHESPK